MPFSMNMRNLFSLPDQEVEKENVRGVDIAQLFGKQEDPNTAFIDSLLGRVKADREAQYGNELFGKVGIEAPRSNPLADLFIGRQGPNLDAVKTYASIKENENQALLREAQIQNYLANQGIKSEVLGLKEQELQRKQQLDQTLNDFLQKLNMGNGNLPVGATARIGNVTVPLNRDLSEQEQSSIAGQAKFEPLVEKMVRLIEKGTISNNPFKQGLAQSGDSAISRLLVQDPDLEQLASARAELFKYAFSEAGKALTGTEKATVKAGLDFVGKSDDQIITDLREAISVLQKKGVLALGGSQAGQQMVAGVKQSVVPPGFKKQINKVTGEERIVPIG